MRFTLSETTDGPMLTLDEEGIEYVEQAMRQLRELAADEELTAPTISESGVGVFIFRRA